jgi:hypothetical protein
MGAEETAVAVIGGGPSGLAISWWLTAQGRPHVVLEQARLGESWRSRRWESLRLVAAKRYAMGPDHHSTQQAAAPLQVPTSLQWRRTLLAACIILAPLSLTLYVVSWTENLRQPLVASATAGATGNALHFIGGVAASFFLPLGYLGMALLGMRRAPGLATLAAALALVGWIPWSALVAADALAYDINQIGSTPQLTDLWVYFNGDPVMSAYLVIYVIGHLLSAIVIGVLLGRLRLIPLWAAWAFALSSPLNVLNFLIPNLALQNALKYLICLCLLLGAVPAALAMLRGSDELGTDLTRSVS